jgi:hypothetical protein
VISTSEYPKSVSRELRAIRSLNIIKIKCVDRLSGKYIVSARGKKDLIAGIYRCLEIYKKNKKSTIAQDVRNLFNNIKDGNNLGLPAVSPSDKIEGKG